MNIKFLIFLSIIAGICSAQKTFSFRSDSLSINVSFLENDSASVIINNLSKDSIYIPTRSNTVPFSIDTIVKECRVQIGMVSGGDCHTRTLVRKLKPSHQANFTFYIGDLDSCNKTDFSFWFTYITATEMSKCEGVILVDEMEVGDCLYDNISQEASFYVRF